MVGNDAGLGVALVYVLFRYEILEVEVSSFLVGWAHGDDT